MQNKKGTIIIFSTAYLPFLGGAETAIKGITDNIDSFGFILLTARLAKGLPKFERSGNLIIYRLGLGSPLDKFFLPFLSFFKVLALRKSAQKPILFWGMMASYGSIGAMLLKIFFNNIPFLLTIQEGNKEWKRNRFWWKLILRKTDYVTALSSFLLQKIRDTGFSGKATIIPNGVELARFRNPNPGVESGKKIISVSRRVHKNGIDVLESAFEIIQKNFPDAELEIASDVSYSEIPKHLRSANVFVRPSRSEGLGTAFLEAMAAGLPVIATQVGGIPDFLKDGETGLFVKVDDPLDLAVKIEMLFNDPVLCQKLSINGLSLVEERYQWSKIGADMERIFSSVI